MNLKIIKPLPTTEETIKAFPLSKAGQTKVARDKQEVKDILSGKDNRMIVLVGPCSAWPFEATLEYAKRLKKLEKEVGDRLKIVMRVYIQKPRTHKGWTGPVTQPDPFGPSDLGKGILYARDLMVRVIELGMPIADEAVFTHNSTGFLELLSWVAIGARSTEDQEHRIHASAMECAVGMKNPTSGSLEIGVNGIIAAQHGHTAAFHGHHVETFGNPYAHLVLRGGQDRTNYHEADIVEAKRLLDAAKVTNPALVVDASHDNCKVDGKKDPIQQMNVVREVLKTLKKQPELRTVVKGFMFESFLKNGCQKLEQVTRETVDRDGLSITDPCLGWEQTEELIRMIAREHGKMVA